LTITAKGRSIAQLISVNGITVNQCNCVDCL